MASSVLVYSYTAGYYHVSIPTASAFLGNLSAPLNATFSFSQNMSDFTTDNLSKYKAIVFLSNTDEILDEPGKAALAQYLASGGNLVGIHSATASLFTTPFFGTALGAFFAYHPADEAKATFIPLTTAHPSTAMLPARWTYGLEEVYSFLSDPRATNVSVLLTVDADSFTDPGHPAAQDNATEGTPHPIAWYRDGTATPLDLTNGTGNALNASDDGGQGFQGTMTGRMWYTSLGHETTTWLDPTFQAHVQGGVAWVLDSTTGVGANSSSGGFNSSTTGNSTSASSRPRSSRLALVGVAGAAALALLSLL